MNTNENAATVFISAIETIASKPENLENFKCYLEHHFTTWLEKFANTPQDLAYEMKQFAELEI